MYLWEKQQILRFCKGLVIGSEEKDHRYVDSEVLPKGKAIKGKSVCGKVG